MADNDVKRKTIGVIRNGKYYRLDKGEIPPPIRTIYGKAPAVHGDEIPDTYCHGTGKTYRSRMEMKLDLKAEGLESVSHSHRFKREEIDNTREWENIIGESYHTLRNGDAKPLDSGEIDGTGRHDTGDDN